MKRLVPLSALVAFPFALFAGTETVNLEVKNMTCAVCPITVKKALEKVPGVITTTMNFDKKQAQVTFDDSETTVDQLREATANAGYPASALLAVAEHAKVPTDSDRISLFNVPLRCPAAPEIGCGSRSKPALLELQRRPGIAEAWLNGTGTVLAVIGKEGSNRVARVKTVQSIFEKSGAVVTELNGKEREIELKSFIARNDWYHGSDVDSLSKREADIIAATLVRRVQAKVTLPEGNAKALETSLATAFRDRFISTSHHSEAADEEQQLLKVAREHLDEKGVAAFQESIAKGYLPQAEDVEETKNKTTVPDCCSIKEASPGGDSTTVTN